MRQTGARGREGQRGPERWNPSAAGVNGTSSTGVQAQLEEIFGKLPLWAWVACASVAALLVGGGVAVASFSRARKKKKRMAKLEDVQPVFQTETWRKLN